MRLDRVRHRDRPAAPRHDGRRARRPPNSPATLGVPAGVNDDLVVVVFIRSSDKSTLPLGCRPSSKQNGTDSDRSWRSPCSCSIRPFWSSRPGRRQRSRRNCCHDERALPVTPRSRHPLRGRRRSRRLRRRLSPTAEGSGPHRVGAASGHRPGAVVHRRFHRAVGEGSPRRCAHQGDYRRPDDDQRPISRGTFISGRIADAA